MQRDNFADKLEFDQATVNGELTAKTLTITNQGTINTITPYTSYIPVTSSTLTDIANRIGAYMQVGPMVSGWMKCQVTPTYAGQVSYTFTLPIAITGTMPIFAIGSVADDNNSPTFENIICKIHTPTSAIVTWISLSNTASEHYLQFTYPAY